MRQNGEYEQEWAEAASERRGAELMLRADSLACALWLREVGPSPSRPSSLAVIVPCFSWRVLLM